MFVKHLRAACVLISLILITSCGEERPEWVESLSDLLPTRARRVAGNDRLGNRDIEELKVDLRRYESLIKEKVDAAEGAVTLYGLLAEQYSELGMYDLALDQYENLLLIEPANHVALNSAAIAAGQTALALPTLEEELVYLRRAQRYYERAIEINPVYRDPYFGLAVLHLFEFEDLEAAKALLLKALSLFPDDTRMLFLLARAAVLEERINDAIQIYDLIIETSGNENDKNSALRNREELLGSY